MSNTGLHVLYTGLSNPRAIGGYNVMLWHDAGVAYWAVSDLAGADLDEFARLFRAAPADQ